MVRIGPMRMGRATRADHMMKFCFVSFSVFQTPQDVMSSSRVILPRHRYHRICLNVSYLCSYLVSFEECSDNWTKYSLWNSFLPGPLGAVNIFPNPSSADTAPMKTRIRVCRGLGPSLEDNILLCEKGFSKIKPHCQWLELPPLLLCRLLTTKVWTLTLQHLDSLEVIKPSRCQGYHHQEDAHGVFGHPQRPLVRSPAAEKEVPGQEEDGQRTDGHWHPPEEGVQGTERDGDICLILHFGNQNRSLIKQNVYLGVGIADDNGCHRFDDSAIYYVAMKDSGWEH